MFAEALCGHAHEGDCAYCEIERLKTVAVAAKALVLSIGDDELARAFVDDEPLTALESALAHAGYDMTDEEFHERCAI